MNFTVQHGVPEPRNNWTYFLDKLSKGHFDITNTQWSFTLHRTSLVDFSFGLISVFSGLFYVKHSSDIDLEVFLRPFHLKSWMTLAFYLMVLIVGYVAIALRTQPKTKHSLFTRAWMLAKQSVNIVLRSVIGKLRSAARQIFQLFLGKTTTTCDSSTTG